MSSLYLTEDWARVKKLVLERDGFTCVDCGSVDTPLVVHHLSYDEFFNPSNLVTLCRPCHARRHGVRFQDERGYTAFFIRDFLLERGKAYSYEVWKELRTERGKRGFATGTYQTFRNYIYWLEKLGLIRFVGEEVGEKPYLEKRRYYALVPERINDKAWFNPRRYLYLRSWKRKRR